MHAATARSHDAWVHRHALFGGHPELATVTATQAQLQVGNPVEGGKAWRAWATARKKKMDHATAMLRMGNMSTIEPRTHEMPHSMEAR